jgi:hypothetical protein
MVNTQTDSRERDLFAQYPHLSGEGTLRLYA